MQGTGALGIILMGVMTVAGCFLCLCLAELATVYLDLGNLHEATTCIQRAISIGRAIKSARCIGTSRFRRMIYPSRRTPVATVQRGRTTTPVQNLQ